LGPVTGQSWRDLDGRRDAAVTIICSRANVVVRVTLTIASVLDRHGGDSSNYELFGRARFERRDGADRAGSHDGYRHRPR
jgi:hypothetical protein